MIIHSRLCDGESYIDLCGFRPSVLNFKATASFWLFFIPNGASPSCYPPQYSYGDLARPGEWYGPGLCHQWEEQCTGHPLGHLPPPFMHIHHIFTTNILLSSYSSISSVMCPAQTRFQCVFSGIVEGAFLVHGGLPWLHQWAAHAHGICGASYYSWSLKMAKIFSPSFLLVLHLSYFLGIFGIFHPKWLKYYKDTFIPLHM